MSTITSHSSGRDQIWIMFTSEYETLYLKELFRDAYDKFTPVTISLNVKPQSQYGCDLLQSETLDTSQMIAGGQPVVRYWSDPESVWDTRAILIGRASVAECFSPWPIPWLRSTWSQFVTVRHATSRAIGNGRMIIFCSHGHLQCDLSCEYNFIRACCYEALRPLVSLINVHRHTGVATFCDLKKQEHRRMYRRSHDLSYTIAYIR